MTLINGDNSLHTTFIPYYSINSVDGIFVFCTATYKLTWNDLPLLVSIDEDATCFHQLLNQIQSLSMQ